MAALSAFAKYVRPAVPGCPEPLVLDAILQACAEFCARTKAVNETVQITTVVGQANYVLPVSAGLEPSEVNRVKRNGFDLDPSSLNEAHKQRLTNRNDMARVFWMDENNELQLAPVPDQVETLDVIVAVMPSASATTVPDALALNRRIRNIAAGARAILFELPKQPWTDLQQAAIDKALFDEAVSNETFKRARGRSHKPLRTRASFF